MAKIKYHKARGMAKITKKTKSIPSVAGEGYEKLHPLVASEIRKKNQEYAVALQQASRIRITGDLSYGHLEPKMESAIEELKRQCIQLEIPYQFADGQIDVFRDILPICLTTQDETEPRAQRIKLDGREAVSTKLSNILFHPFQMLHLLCNALLFGFSENTIQLVIINVMSLMCQIYQGTEIKLNKTCATVLLCLYQTGYASVGIDEDALIERVRKKNNTLTEEDLRYAVETLAKYRCISLESGKVTLIETMG